MNVQVNHIDEHELELTVLVPWEKVQDDYNDLLKRYANVPLKGFRPGKTPLKLVESTFKQELNNDFASLSSPRILKEALKVNDISIGSPVELVELDIKPNLQFGFKARFLQMPEFSLPNYNALAIAAIDDDEKRNEISEKLLAQVDINLPDKMVEQEIALSGTDITEKGSEEWIAAEQRVKLLLILKKIATEESVEVDEKDVEDRIRRVAKENGVSTSELKEYLLANGGLSRLRDYLLAEQVFDYIIQG